MAPILNTQAITGLPICLSGFTHPVALSKEMADHDRRRKGFKKIRFGARKDLHAAADQERVGSLLPQRSHERVSQEIRSGEEVAGDLAAAADVALVIHDLSRIALSSCTAKAA